MNGQPCLDSCSCAQLLQVTFTRPHTAALVGAERNDRLARPVVCIGREAASGTSDGFESITGTEDKCKYTQELTSTGDVVQTVSSNPNAIGYASLASVKDSVKAVSVEGVAPSNETILSGDYKIQRDFILVTKKDNELTGSAKDFFDYCMSRDADEYITKAGAVPVRIWITDFVPTKSMLANKISCSLRLKALLFQLNRKPHSTVSKGHLSHIRQS